MQWSTFLSDARSNIMLWPEDVTKQLPHGTPHHSHRPAILSSCIFRPPSYIFIIQPIRRDGLFLFQHEQSPDYSLLQDPCRLSNLLSSGGWTSSQVKSCRIWLWHRLTSGQPILTVTVLSFMHVTCNFDNLLLMNWSFEDIFCNQTLFSGFSNSAWNHTLIVSQKC